MLTFFTQVHAFVYPCSHTYSFSFLPCWPRTMWTDIRIFRESEALESHWWKCLLMVPNQFKHSWETNDVSGFIWLKVSTWWYRNIDFYNSIQWCSRRSWPRGFKIFERPWRYHAIESPCLVTELLLRRLALDSKILLQNPVNTVQTHQSVSRRPWSNSVSPTPVNLEE